MIGFYFIPIAFACGLGLGVLAGLWIYAHVYGHFLAREEDRANRKVLKALQEHNKKQVDAKLVAQRLKEMYGNDLSARHQEVISEEVERVLGTGPNGGVNAR